MQKILDKKEKDYISIHINRYNYLLKQINRLHLQPNKDTTVLDIGCYPPHMYDNLSSLGFNVYGISSYHEKLNRPNIKTLNIENENFPFKDNFFDLIIFTEVLEHLISDPTQLFLEIKRILKPNGYLILTTPNAARSQNLFLLLSGNNFYFPLSQLKESDLQKGSIYHRHNREYVIKEIISFIQNTKLSLIQKKHFISYTPFRDKNKNDPPHLKIIKYLNFIFMITFARFRDTIFILAQKQ